MIVTHKQIMDLAYCIFKLMMIYKIVSTVCTCLIRFPDTYRIIRGTNRDILEAKERTEERRAERAKELEVTKKSSNYKFTNIGFSTTTPTDELES